MPREQPTTASAPTADSQLNRPDLQQYRAMHHAIRTSNQRLVSALADLQRNPRQSAIPALQRWVAGYCQELRNHHQIEDTIFFPALAARVPSYADYAKVLDDDHHQLETLVEQIDVTVEQLTGATEPQEQQLATALMRAVELRDLMSAHLDVEDREILPMFERHFEAPEYEAMDVRARRSVSMKHAMFFVPWFMTSARPDDAAALMRKAPPPLKAIDRITRRRYARLVERGLGRSAHLEADWR